MCDYLANWRAWSRERKAVMTDRDVSSERQIRRWKRVAGGKENDKK